MTSLLFSSTRIQMTNFLASLGKLNNPALQRKLTVVSYLPRNTNTVQVKGYQRCHTHSSFSQINQEIGISDKCHLLIFQRDKFWWCDQQVPRLFLACSTKIVTMATLRGQTSKEMHCEHRNSRTLTRKEEGGSAGGFPKMGAGASPLHPQG